MTKATINGKMTSCYIAFDTVTIYFQVTTGIEELFKLHMYALLRLKFNITISGDNIVCPAELKSMDVQSANKIVMVFVITANGSEQLAWARRIGISTTLIAEYNESMPKAEKRIDSSFFKKLQSIERDIIVSTNVSTEAEFRTILKQIYGRTLFVSSQMLQSDGEDYYNLLIEYAGANNIKVTDRIAMEQLFIKKRITLGLCTVCPDPYFDYIDGMPLCKNHHAERLRFGSDDKGRIKFNYKYHLGE